MAKVQAPLDSFNGISYAEMSKEQIDSLVLFPSIKAGYDIWFQANEGKRYIKNIEKGLDQIFDLDGCEIFRLNSGKHTLLKTGTYRVDQEILSPVIDEKTGTVKENGLYYTLTLQVGDKRGPLSVTPAASSGTRAPNGKRKMTVNGVEYDSATEALVKGGDMEKGVDGLPETMSRQAIRDALTAKGFVVAPDIV